MQACGQLEDGTPCDDMKKTRDNRKIIIFYPANQFIKYGGKRLQNPQLSRVFNNRKDVILANEYELLLQEIMPNFFEQIISLEDYVEWMKSRQIPKVIFLSRQDQIPMTLRKLGVHYFGRYELAYVSDLTESIVEKMNITTFPKLLAVTFNYESKTYDIFQYKDTDFSAASYHKIKEFFDQHALKEPISVLFDKVKMPKYQELHTVEKRSQVFKFLDNADGWTIISQVEGEPVKLKALRQKYGQFFDYIHFNDGNETEILSLYEKDKQQSFHIEDQIDFKVLQKRQFLQSTAAWLNKNYVIIAVRQKYSHLCALEKANLFNGLTHCLIIKQSDYKEVTEALKIPFDIGFACYQTSAKVKDKLVGKNFKSSEYQQVYNTVQMITKRKSKEIIDDFKAQPVSHIQKADTLKNICSFPNKRCAILFTNGNKRDITAFEYLQEIAVNFINDYEFFEINLSCNAHFEQEIPHLKNNYGGLLVYHPKKQSYVFLKARLSKSTFDKFLKANLRDNKKLPFHELSNKQIKVNVCLEDVKVTDSIKKQNDSL